MNRLAIQCNPAGRIVRVVRDDASVLGTSSVGRMLSTAMISSGAAHVFELLGKLEECEVVCGWMLELGSQDAPSVYHCAAARDEDGVVIAGADEPLDGGSLVALMDVDDARLREHLQRMDERAADPAAVVEDLRAQVAALQYQTKMPIKLENELLRVAAHDLRNPLLVVSMNCSFLLHDCRDLSEEQRALLSDTIETSDFMTRYLDGMTRLTRVWVGALELELEVLDVAELVRQVTAGSAEGAGRRGIRIELERAEGVQIEADRLKLEQVLHQLFSNVMKFCPSGTRARVVVERSGDEVQIAIEDDGPGMPRGMRDKLFRPFGKPHTDTTAPADYGAGVGLAISRRLIEAHGGRIEVATEEGKGTRVVLYVPVARS